MEAEKWTDVVSAVSAAVSALAIIFATMQLKATKIIRQLEFEDRLDQKNKDLSNSFKESLRLDVEKFLVDPLEWNRT